MWHFTSAGAEGHNAAFPSPLNFIQDVHSVLYGQLSPWQEFWGTRCPHGPALGDACDPVPPISLLCLLLLMLFKNIEAPSAETLSLSERNKGGTRTAEQNYRCVWRGRELEPGRL